jgi:D-alanine transfer protein
MNRPSFSPLIVAVAIFGILLCLPDKWLLSFVNDKVVQRAANDLDPNMFQGYLIQQKMLENPSYLPIYGSSELSRQDAFHPSNYFKVNPDGFTPFLVGRGGTEPLVHFLNFSVHTNEMKNKKMVFILSPQWFVPEGMNEIHFDPNFSVLQGYKFALSPKVNHKLVVEGSKRLLSYNVVKKDPLLASILEANVYQDKYHQVKAHLLKPVAFGFLKVLERRDFFLSVFEVPMRKLHPKPPLTHHETWARLDHNAMIMAKRKSDSNRFYIDNLYYDSMILPKVVKLKGYKQGASYAESPQYQDLQMVLDVLKEAHAKPLFVSVPVNGYWSDYTGFPKQGRKEYYAKVKEQIESNGFSVLDLSHYEYDKYFFKDTIHLGYKGWVAVDKGITQFEAQK